MGLSLKELEKAMAPLATVGKGELDFDVLGTRVWLRCLTPEEEIDVQRSARSAIAEGDLTDQVGALEYLDKFRKSSLGYSIVQIGALDFRNEEFIETGETLPNGQKVKIRRHEALQGLVATWSRPMQIAVYTKFGELMDQVEKEAEGLIEINPIDHDAEISRLEERIRELKDEKARAVATNADSRTAVRRQVASVKKTRIRPTSGTAPVDDQQETKEEAESVLVPSDFDREISEEEPAEEEPVEEEPVEEEEVPPEAEPTPPSPRKPVFARATGAMPPPAPVPPTASTAPPEPGAPPEGPPVSSFVDANDPDAMSAAIEVENQRILDRKRVRTPPHLAAKVVGETLAKEMVPNVERFQKAVSSAPVASGRMMDGKEVFKMPEQVMTDRGRNQPPAPAVVPVNQPSKNINPRFKPTTKK